LPERFPEPDPFAHVGEGKIKLGFRRQIVQAGSQQKAFGKIGQGDT
jgi:hypothetical protein